MTAEELIARRNRTNAIKSRRLLARKLKQQGLTYQMIAEHLHISRQRAQQLVSFTPKERIDLIKRAGGRCQDCGKRSKKLDTHHESYSGPPTKVLCVSCHKRADGELGYTRKGTNLSNIIFRCMAFEMANKPVSLKA